MTAERDWEAAARKRLESTVTNVTEQLQRMAAQIGQEAAHTIEDASTGRTQYATYGRVAERVVHTVAWGVANLNLANVIDAASDAQAAQAEKKAAKDSTPVTNAKLGSWGALHTMLGVAEGWAETAHENELAMDHRDVKRPDEQAFFLADIRTMLNDAARELGLANVWDTEKGKANDAQ
jgi:hypothetical protein